MHDRLGYLLKHAHLALAEQAAPALAPYGVNGRELAVLSLLDSGEPPAQQEAAARLGVDRTTMVSLVDELEAKGLVERRPDPGDRRRNLVHLTPAGRRARDEGTVAADAAEAAFLAPLAPAERDQLRAMLRRVLGLTDRD